MLIEIQKVGTVIERKLTRFLQSKSRQLSLEGNNFGCDGRTKPLPSSFPLTMFARLLIVICFRCKDRACKHLCVSKFSEWKWWAKRRQPFCRSGNNVRARSFSSFLFFFLFFFFSFLLFYADLYERSGGFTGQDISMFVFSNLQHLLLLTIFIHVSRFYFQTFFPSRYK